MRACAFLQLFHSRNKLSFNNLTDFFLSCCCPKQQKKMLIRLCLVCFETVAGFYFHGPIYRYLCTGLYTHNSSMCTHGKELGFRHSFTFY